MTIKAPTITTKATGNGEHTIFADGNPITGLVIALHNPGNSNGQYTVQQRAKAGHWVNVSGDKALTLAQARRFAGKRIYQARVKRAAQ